jgi:hypothetical protein
VHISREREGLIDRHRAPSPLRWAALALALACAPRAVPAPPRASSGALAFVRADSLADTTSGQRVSALGGTGTATVIIGSANGCDVVAPTGRWTVDGSVIRAAVSGVRRVMVCHDPMPSRPRAWAARIGGLAPGSYDVVVSFTGESPTWPPVRRAVRVR